MLPPQLDMTSTPKKIIRLSQTKAAMDQAHALEKSISRMPDDDRDEVASNTSVAVSRESTRVLLTQSISPLSCLEFIRIFEEDLNPNSVLPWRLLFSIL